jgi:hypothetical protein
MLGSLSDKMRVAKRFLDPNRDNSPLRPAAVE